MGILSFIGTLKILVPSDSVQKGRDIIWDVLKEYNILKFC